MVVDGSVQPGGKSPLEQKSVWFLVSMGDVLSLQVYKWGIQSRNVCHLFGMKIG